MDFSLILGGLTAMYPAVLKVCQILGALVVAGQVVVALTPSPTDDAVLAKLKSMQFVGAILAALSKFAPFQKG